MIITVRCFFIPADIAFDTDSVTNENFYNDGSVKVWFGEDNVIVDSQHYLAEKGKQEAL